jgi:hypothetical protein
MRYCTVLVPVVAESATLVPHDFADAVASQLSQDSGIMGFGRKWASRDKVPIFNLRLPKWREAAFGFAGLTREAKGR